MKNTILEQFVNRVIDILVESRLDERIQANKDFKNALLKKRSQDSARKQGEKPNHGLAGIKTKNFDGGTASARIHHKTHSTNRPGAFGHTLLARAGEARRKGDKEESKSLTRTSKTDRVYSNKKPLP